MSPARSTKLDEETQELHSAVENGTNFEEELGDVLFAAVKVGRFCGVDPEAALTKTCEKFIARFRKVEETVNARGEDMSALPLDELMALWNNAKDNSDDQKRQRFLLIYTPEDPVSGHYSGGSNDEQD